MNLIALHFCRDSFSFTVPGASMYRIGINDAYMSLDSWWKNRQHKIREWLSNKRVLFAYFECRNYKEYYRHREILEDLKQHSPGILYGISFKGSGRSNARHLNWNSLPFIGRSAWMKQIIEELFGKSTHSDVSTKASIRNQKPAQAKETIKGRPHQPATPSFGDSWCDMWVPPPAHSFWTFLAIHTTNQVIVRGKLVSSSPTVLPHLDFLAVQLRHATNDSHQMAFAWHINFWLSNHLVHHRWHSLRKT